MYAAGFIYGLINGLSLDKCGAAGSILAGKVIEVIGPKLDPTRWKESRDMIKNL
jgi:sugar/nucleoside kinase (ribokinase family)